MGPITISTEQFIAAVVAASGFVTGVWHVAMYIGKLSNRVSRVEDRVDDHDDIIDRRFGSKVER